MYTSVLATTMLMRVMSVRLIRSVRGFYRIAVPIIAVIALVSVPILRAPYIQSRFDTIGVDLQTRIAQWRHAAALKPGGRLRSVFGAGLGSLPRYKKLPFAVRFVPRLSFPFFLVLFASYIYVNLQYKRYVHKSGNNMGSAE